MRCDHCPVRAGLDCLGQTTPALCAEVEAGRPGRADQLVRLAETGSLGIGHGETPEDVRAALARVRECPDRGGVLPVPLQPEGCGRCGELSECRAGKGSVPGRVTLRECLECRAIT